MRAPEVSLESKAEPLMPGYLALAMPRLHGLERKYADLASDVVYYGLTIAGIAFRAIADESYSVFTSRLPEAVGARTQYQERNGCINGMWVDGFLNHRLTSFNRFALKKSGVSLFLLDGEVRGKEHIASTIWKVVDLPRFIDLDNGMPNLYCHRAAKQLKKPVFFRGLFDIVNA